MSIKTIAGVFAGIALITASTPAIAGNQPPNVPGKSGNAQCLTSSNANEIAKLAVSKSANKTCQIGDGLSPETAGSSAYQIKQNFPFSASGLYWVKNSNINFGEPFQIYADMDNVGGGWTLIVANSSQNWSYSQARLVNQAFPPADPRNLSSLAGKYSILEYADFLKKSKSHFQYRMDAIDYGLCGGVWTSLENYSFVSNSNQNTSIRRDYAFDLYSSDTFWNYDNDSIEARMPYLTDHVDGLLTTSIDSNSSWWGTIIQSSNWENKTVPWMWNVNGCDRPDKIWYWVR